MPPQNDTLQAITNAESSGSSPSLPSTSSTNIESTSAAISTDSSTLVRNPDEEMPRNFENGLICSDDKGAIETSDNTMIEGSTDDSNNKSEEIEHQEDREQAMATQQNECPEDGEKDIITTKHQERTVKEEVESQKAEASENDDSSKSTSKQNADDDIEWLSPFSLPRVKENEDHDNKQGASTEKNGIDKSLKMLKKGAVAAVGGTMVGMGLVMIPLPTPFGAVVASSGLAVLGTEFNEAKELNDRLIGGAKGHLSKARDSIVKGIEKMNPDESKTDNSSSSNNNTLNSNDNSVEKETGEARAVIKMNAASSFGSDGNIDGDEDEGSNDNESGSTSEPPPVWLHMNPIERNRQEKLAKERYRRDSQTSYEQAKEAFTKRTGKFLSKNLLPFIKKSEPSDAKGQTAVIDKSTTEAKSDGDRNNMSATEKGNNLQTDENRTSAELEKKDEEFRESPTIETNDRVSDGFVVVS